jgi:hypothetical protein
VGHDIYIYNGGLGEIGDGGKRERRRVSTVKEI